MRKVLTVSLVSWVLMCTGCAPPGAKAPAPIQTGEDTSVRDEVTRRRSPIEIDRALSGLVDHSGDAYRSFESEAWTDAAVSVDAVKADLDSLGMGTIGSSSDGMRLPRTVNFLQRALIKKDKEAAKIQANAVQMRAATVLQQRSPSEKNAEALFVATCRYVITLDKSTPQSEVDPHIKLIGGTWNFIEQEMKARDPGWAKDMKSRVAGLVKVTDRDSVVKAIQGILSKSGPLATESRRH